MKYTSIQKNKGFTLIETLVAVSIFTLSVVGMLLTLSSGLTDTNYVKQKVTATYLAQEGIEGVRNLRDNYMLFGGANGWSDFITEVTTIKQCDTNGGATVGCGYGDYFLPHPLVVCTTTIDCAIKLCGDKYEQGAVCMQDSGFTRVITIVPDPSNNDEIKVTTTVSWVQPSGVQSVSFSENLLNWYTAP